MNMPSHWRVMIVSHHLKQVLLLDPFGNASEPYGFTEEELDNVRNAYVGYSVSTSKERIQTDGWNCGVWVALMAEIWMSHLKLGLEGSKDISKVIQEGLMRKGVSDINTHPMQQSHNEKLILQVRRQYRQDIYDNSHPTHLTNWLNHWNTPIEEVQAIETNTHLPRTRQATSIRETLTRTNLKGDNDGTNSKVSIT